MAAITTPQLAVIAKQLVTQPELVERLKSGTSLTLFKRLAEGKNKQPRLNLPRWMLIQTAG
jgi:hypothetical protein